MKNKEIKKSFLTTLVTILCFTNLFAQEKTAEELAKMAQNPLANMMSFPFQNNTTFGMGEYDGTSNVLNIQPVLPFYDGHLITRTIVPIVSQPAGETETATGVGDINFSAFYSPIPKNGLIWGVGPALVIPTGSDVSSKNGVRGPLLLCLK